MDSTHRSNRIVAIATATRGCGGLRRAYFQWRYAILFYSLLFTFAAGPLLDALGFDANLLELCLAVNLLAAVLPIGGRRTRLLFLTIVAAVLGPAGWGGLVRRYGAVDGELSLCGRWWRWWRQPMRCVSPWARPWWTGSISTLRSVPTCWPGSSLASSTGCSNRPGQVRSARRARVYRVASRWRWRLTSASSRWRRLATATLCPAARWRAAWPSWRPSRVQLYLAVMIARLVSLYISGEGKGNQRDAQDGPDGSAP